MHKLLISILFFLFVVSCAAPQSINMPQIIADAKVLSPGGVLTVVTIPSHGAISDAAIIATNGGGNANMLRDDIVRVSREGGGSIVVASKNPALSKACISGALSDLKLNKNNIQIIYAGSIEHNRTVRLLVEGKGLSYKFIDAFKKQP